MAQPMRGTNVPDGLEPVPQDHRYPEFVPPYDEKQVSPHQRTAAPAAAGTAAGGKTICGVRRPTFFLLLLLILVIIIAAVAGGVGGSVAVSKAYDRGKADAAAEGLTEGSTSGGTTTIGDSDSDSDGDDEPTSASPSDRIQPPPTEGVVPLDCPDLSDTIQSVELGDKSFRFRVNCGVNHGGGGGAEDMMILPAYSFEDCMKACAAFNDVGVIDKTCIMAHFNAHLLSQPAGNCWLKSRIGDSTEAKDDEKDMMVEAEFLKD